jgi:hypothetical protein
LRYMYPDRSLSEVQRVRGNLNTPHVCTLLQLTTIQARRTPSNFNL